MFDLKKANAEAMARFDAQFPTGPTGPRLIFYTTFAEVILFQEVTILKTA
jgi:hypothetical protein